MSELLETPLSEAEVRLLCEERWTYIEELLTENKEQERLLLAAALKYTGLEAKLSKMASERNETPKVSARHATEIHAGVEKIYAEGKEQERMMDESEQVSQESELHKEYDALYGHADPTDESPPYWYWLETKVAALEAKLEAVRQIMDQPWDDSHDRGRDEAFKRLAKISNALNMNSDPVTEDTPSAEALAGESDNGMAVCKS